MSKQTLDQVVIDALKLHESQELPHLNLGNSKRRLVIASGNALPSGKIIFADEDAIFANESEYEELLTKIKSIDGVVVISASGEKHAPVIIESLLRKNVMRLKPYLLTCNGQSSAASMLDSDHVIVTKKNQEPLTYNASTYIGMILAKTRESSGKILQFIEEEIDPTLQSMDRALSEYDSFFILVGNQYNHQREMLTTKFDELFGPKINGRCFTFPQTLHARTVVGSETELFINLQVRNDIFGHENSRLNLPIFREAGHAAVVAIGYYVIGKIQSQFDPWFLNSIDAYADIQSDLFKMHFERNIETRD